MFVQAGRGSLLLPTKMPGVTAFWRHCRRQYKSLTIDPCDYAWVEVTLEGIWMARTATSEQGSLVVDLGGADGNGNWSTCGGAVSGGCP